MAVAAKFREAALRGKRMLEQGFDPRTFFHGSFEDIKAFDPDRTYPGSFMGRGQYITTSPVDAYENYARSTGGDVVSKIDNLAERAFQYAEDLHQGLPHEKIAEFYRPQEIELARKVMQTDPGIGGYGWQRGSDYMTDAAIRQLDSSGNVLPLKARLGNILRYHEDPEAFDELRGIAGWGDEDFSVAKRMKEMGYDSVEHDPTVHFRMPNLEANKFSGGKPALHYMVPDASRLRVPWAKFDPKKMNSTDLLAAVAPMGIASEEKVKAVVSKLREKAEPYLTLDPEKGQEANLGAEIAIGLTPGLGQAQAARDFERARRSDDALGMGLAVASAVPLLGKPAVTAIRALRKGIRR